MRPAVERPTLGSKEPARLAQERLPAVWRVQQHVQQLQVCIVAGARPATERQRLPDVAQLDGQHSQRSDDVSRLQSAV